MIIMYVKFRSGFNFVGNENNKINEIKTPTKISVSTVYIYIYIYTGIYE